MMDERKSQGNLIVSIKATALFILLPHNPLFLLPVESFAFPDSPCRRTCFLKHAGQFHQSSLKSKKELCQKNSEMKLRGWIEQSNGEWEWKEDDRAFLARASVGATTTADVSVSTSAAKAAPKLPSGSFRPKQSLGQNFLQDGNTIQKIVKAFAKDASETIHRKDSKSNPVAIEGEKPGVRAVELGPGAGALTGPLIETFGTEDLQCIEIDPRAIELLSQSHPTLRVTHMDVLKADYVALAKQEGGPLSVVGNVPYYITSQILFALADASHSGAVRSATVTMQWEVAQRIVAPTNCKAYGILSVVFQLYADCTLHFKIPPTVFYPKPKVDSALVGLRFIGPVQLRERLGGVSPLQLRRVLTCIFQQRRKTVRNSLKKLVLELCGGDTEAADAILSSQPLSLSSGVAQAREEGDEVAKKQELPLDWASLRPEQLSPGQIVEITRLIFSRSSELVGVSPHGNFDNEEIQNDESYDAQPFGNTVWRKLKYGLYRT